MSTFLNVEHKSTGILPGLLSLSIRLKRGWGSTLCHAPLSQGYSWATSCPATASTTTCRHLSPKLQTPISSCYLLPIYLSDVNLKPASSALLFRWFAIIPRIRATSSSDTRFYLTWFYSSLTSPTPALQYSPGGPLTIGRRYLHFFDSNGLLHICLFIL